MDRCVVYQVGSMQGVDCHKEVMKTMIMSREK